MNENVAPNLASPTPPEETSQRDPITSALGAIAHALTQDVPSRAAPPKKPPHEPERGKYGDPAKKAPNRRREPKMKPTDPGTDLPYMRWAQRDPEVARKVGEMGPGPGYRQFAQFAQTGPRYTDVVGPQTPHDIAKYHAQRLKAEAGEAARDPSQTYLAEQIHQKLGRRLTPEEADYLPKGPTEDAQRAAVFDVLSMGPGKIAGDVADAIVGAITGRLVGGGMEHMAARGMAAEEEATMGTARPRRPGMRRAGPVTVEGPKALPGPRPPEGGRISEPNKPPPAPEAPDRATRQRQARVDAAEQSSASQERPTPRVQKRRTTKKGKTPNIAADLIGDIEKRTAGKEVTKSAEAPSDEPGISYKTTKRGGGYVGRALDTKTGKVLGHTEGTYDSADQALEAIRKQHPTAERGAAPEQGPKARGGAGTSRSQSKPFDAADLQRFARWDDTLRAAEKAAREAKATGKKSLMEKAQAVLARAKRQRDLGYYTEADKADPWLRMQRGDQAEIRLEQRAGKRQHIRDMKLLKQWKRERERGARPPGAGYGTLKKYDEPPDDFDLQLFGGRGGSRPTGKAGPRTFKTKDKRGSLRDAQGNINLGDIPGATRNLIADQVGHIRAEGTRGQGGYIYHPETGEAVSAYGAVIRGRRGVGAEFNDKDVERTQAIIRRGTGIRVSLREAEEVLGQMFGARPWMKRTIPGSTKKISVLNPAQRHKLMPPEMVDEEINLARELETMSAKRRASAQAGVAKRRGPELPKPIPIKRPRGRPKGSKNKPKGGGGSSGGLF